ncbi:MAG: N-acetylmuramoyl-L-alanine amidase, partial [Proteobacteria bacterium]|nr:N-acetylmuramoyl-L-alanine amidase [Pseudomonadota bacterium]
MRLHDAYRAVAQLCLILALATAAIPALAQSPTVTGVRAGINADATRFVLDLTGPISFDVFVLDNPDRIVIDLSEVAWELSADSQALDAGLIEAFRYGLFEPGRSRIVLDVGGPAAVRDAFLLAPSANFGYRFVLDLAPRAAGEVQEASLQATSVVTDAPVFEAAAWDGPPLPAEKPALGARVIVIDAGHGGVDPGAIGASGAFEKDLTLAAARELRRLLEARGGYHVVLTRDSDIFLKLGERVDLARSNGADLFISIHADSIADSSVRGAGVYSLSETASDDEAAALAARENKADLISGVDFVNVAYDPLTTNILIDLAQRETKNASSEFAGLVAVEIAQAVRLRSNAHRFAGFRVLKAPDVPSVLLEMG